MKAPIIGDTGLIMDIDHFAVHDGPGIRACVYFKGCPLSCAWCHSPESQSSGVELLYAANRCQGCKACASLCPVGAHQFAAGSHLFNREKCVACGECSKRCPSGALSMSARFVSLDEVVGELEEDMIFYRNSGGGVTLSGGEVLSQAPFAAKVLERLKTSGVHTIVETSGYGRLEDLLKIAAHADMFYYDFKLGNEDEFRLHTGGRADLPLGNLRALRNVTDAITLRVPLVPGITDTLSNVMAAYSLALSLDLRHVHLLPYNASASAKYEWIGKAFPLGELTPEPGAWERLKDAAPEGLEVLIQ